VAINETQCGYGPESTHGWDPLSGWVGRYRCRFCRAIGHRMTGDSEAKFVSRGRPVELIVPYKCTRKGCDHGAVQRNPKQLCDVHARALSTKAVKP